jgi:hypothetical protein
MPIITRTAMMIMKGHPELIPHPHPPPIMPPPRPVLISANAEILKTTKPVKTIIPLFILALLLWRLPQDTGGIVFK